MIIEMSYEIDLDNYLDTGTYFECSECGTRAFEKSELKHDINCKENK